MIIPTNRCEKCLEFMYIDYSQEIPELYCKNCKKTEMEKKE